MVQFGAKVVVATVKEVRLMSKAMVNKVLDDVAIFQQPLGKLDSSRKMIWPVGWLRNGDGDRDNTPL